MTEQEQLELEELESSECQVDRWWALAAMYPLEAIESPLFGLLALEDPGRWMAMQTEYVDAWIEICLGQVRSYDLRLFLADCQARLERELMRRSQQASSGLKVEQYRAGTRAILSTQVRSPVNGAIAFSAVLLANTATTEAQWNEIWQSERLWQLSKLLRILIP